MTDNTNEFSFILKPSTISGAGIGVFATHTIHKGKKIQVAPRYSRSRRLNCNQIPEAFKGYCVIEDNNICRVPVHFNRMEIGWFINHSFTPNIEKRNGKLYTVRTIVAGEEILMDYNDLNEPEDKKEDYYKK